MPDPETNSRPTAQDAARRLVVLKYVVASAMIAPPRDLLIESQKNWPAEDREEFARDALKTRDEFWGSLHDEGLGPYLSPRERQHAQETMLTMSYQQQADASWRMEAVAVLMWALGLTPAMPTYDTQADSELLKQIPSRGVPAFVRSAQLRKEAVIDRARRIAEFWHWRSRTRELIERGDKLPADAQMQAAGLRTFDDIVRMSAKHGVENGLIAGAIDDDFAACGKAYRDLTDAEWSPVRSITIERHFALNWLCGYAANNNWDETPTDT